MKYKHIILYSLIMPWIAGICSNSVACKKESKVTDYCECDFYDDPGLTQKFYVGWVGDAEKSNPAAGPSPLIRINRKNYLGFKKIYEKFCAKLGSNGEFILSKGKDKVKGDLKVVSNCSVDPSDKCESVEFKGKVEVIIYGVQSTYNVSGGCGC